MLLLQTSVKNFAMKKIPVKSLMKRCWRMSAQAVNMPNILMKQLATLTLQYFRSL